MKHAREIVVRSLLDSVGFNTLRGHIRNYQPNIYMPNPNRLDTLNPGRYVSRGEIIVRRKIDKVYTTALHVGEEIFFPLARRARIWNNIRLPLILLEGVSWAGLIANTILNLPSVHSVSDVPGLALATMGNLAVKRILLNVPANLFLNTIAMRTSQIISAKRDRRID